ncbi:MAG: hypothetical protein K1X50_03205 [Candidatus Promineofilum sp.]|nr:hypothetical protein [Promineifilum sp.]MCW5864664.1 DUF4332 domain-containing protein [Anaerolineae bacterium]
MRKGSALLAAFGSLSVGVAAVSAQQTPTPVADAAAQTGGPLGLSWWLWVVLILLLLFLLWWLFLRRKPVPPPPEPPRRSATYEPPAAPMTPATPVVPPAPTYEPPTRAAMPEVPLMAEPEPAFMEPEPSFMEPDDLKRIEGIGPRIAGILNAAGITTFEALSLTSVERLREILVAAELRGSFGDPTTWPEQARLAAAGLWDDLQRMQDSLKGGR